MKALRDLFHLEDQEAEIKRNKAAWLRAQGWNYSSDYPATLWLWSKEFPQSDVQWRWKDGRKVPHPGFSLRGVSMDVAILIEAAWLDVWVRHDHSEPAQEDSNDQTPDG